MSTLCVCVVNHIERIVGLKKEFPPGYLKFKRRLQLCPKQKRKHGFKLSKFQRNSGLCPCHQCLGESNAKKVPLLQNEHLRKKLHGEKKLASNFFVSIDSVI